VIRVEDILILELWWEESSDENVVYTMIRTRRASHWIPTYHVAQSGKLILSTEANLKCEEKNFFVLVHRTGPDLEMAELILPETMPGLRLE
jgi:hypothetical protein